MTVLTYEIPLNGRNSSDYNGFWGGGPLFHLELNMSYYLLKFSKNS